jgi:hypothetical protein
MLDKVGELLSIGDRVVYLANEKLQMAVIRDMDEKTHGVQVQEVDLSGATRSYPFENILSSVHANLIVRTPYILNGTDISGIPFDYVKRLYLDASDSSSLTEDFLFNTLVDGDLVLFQGLRGFDLGRVCFDRSSKEQSIHVLKRSGVRSFKVDRIIGPILGKKLVLVPRISQYHCADTSVWHKHVDCYSSVNARVKPLRNFS